MPSRGGIDAYSLFPVIRGEGWERGSCSMNQSPLDCPRTLPLSPALSPITGRGSRLSTMPQQILQVDDLTDKAFSGNPAGVCILEKPADEKWMQNVAMEMAVAETSFLHPIEGGWSLRWFTPTTEIALCGHGTIAAAHALLEAGRMRGG